MHYHYTSGCVLSQWILRVSGEFMNKENRDSYILSKKGTDGLSYLVVFSIQL